MAPTARTGRTRRRTWEGGHDEHRHVYPHPHRAPRRPSPHRRLLAVLVVVVLALVGGGFWVLGTYGKKSRHRFLESIIQPPWIKDAMAYAPEPAAAAKAPVAHRHYPLLAEQLTALQEEFTDTAGGPGGPKRPPAPPRPPGAESGTGRAGPGEGVRVDAPYLARPEGGDRQSQGQ